MVRQWDMGDLPLATVCASSIWNMYEDVLPEGCWSSPHPQTFYWPCKSPSSGGAFD